MSDDEEKRRLEEKLEAAKRRKHYRDMQAIYGGTNTDPGILKGRLEIPSTNDGHVANAADLRA